ncbi:MAG: FHA domain-containing protein [Anaerolineales bacterium]|nr:FHA domain-containing protein [Anaerolineales bacterium]
MHQKLQERPFLILLFILISLGLTGTAALAQDTQPAPPRLHITNADTTSPPSIVLQAYGIDSDGSALALSASTVNIEHNGQPVTPEVAGTSPVGTLTVFLIDIPEGVADQIPAVQDAIQQFASDPTMREGTDYVAVYKVGESEPTQLLAPTNFHNSVANLFATPLEPETGATALIDSTMSLLNQIDGLKPDPAMVASLVVMSDGTDAVSTQYSDVDVAPRAATLGIPVHTIWLTNTALPPVSQEIGQNYLSSVSAGSRGMAARMENPGELPPIWQRVASFRDQTRLRYVVDNLGGGEADVVLSLADNPEVRAETTVEVSNSVPSIVIDLPPESRLLTLPNLDDPVKLRFTTAVSWLDGVDRSVEAAQLIVNSTVVQDIPVNQLSSFEAEIDNLVYGDNNVQVAILDDQGIPVTSPPILLTVQEGSRDIPEELATGSTLGTIARTLFILLLAAAVIGALIFLAVRQGWLTRLSTGARPRRERPVTASYDEAPAQDEYYAAGPVVSSTEPIAYLEVLESVTRMPDFLALNTNLVKLGRSPAQADIAFENDITVSRMHASLHLEGAHFRIFDERSTSGTWVNEQQVPEYGIQLMDGDEIHLGAVHLRYREA